MQLKRLDEPIYIHIHGVVLNKMVDLCVTHHTSRNEGYAIFAEHMAVLAYLRLDALVPVRHDTDARRAYHRRLSIDVRAEWT